ncbi:hypothetical protein PC119_g6489 [Phytophthora cactorum]|nr:hypothetical protein PC119_g6489 [Phytophthora cactorum]
MHRGRELDEVAAALADVQARQQSLARGSVLSRASSPSPSVSAVPSPSPSPPPVSKEKTQRAAAPFLWLKRRVVRCSDRKESDALEDLGSLELVSSASLASVRALIGQFIVLPPRREFVFVHPTTNMPVTAAEESDICAGDLSFICLVLLPVKEPPAARDTSTVSTVTISRAERKAEQRRPETAHTQQQPEQKQLQPHTVAAGVAAAVPSDPRPVPVVKRDRVSPGAVRTGRERQVALQPVQEERKQPSIEAKTEAAPLRAPTKLVESKRAIAEVKLALDSKRASSANLPERLKPRQTKITGQDTTDRQGSERLGRRRVASAGSDAVATERKGVEEKLAVSLIPEALHAAQDKALEIVATSQSSPSTQQQVREGDSLQQTLSGDTKIANPAPEIPTSLGKTVHQTPGHLHRSRRFKALTAEKSWGCEEPEEQELATDAEVEDFLQSFLEIVRTGLEDVDARQLDTALLYYGVDYCALKLNGVLLGLDTELGTRCTHARWEQQELLKGTISRYCFHGPKEDAFEYVFVRTKLSASAVNEMRWEDRDIVGRKEAQHAFALLCGDSLEAPGNVAIGVGVNIIHADLLPHITSMISLNTILREYSGATSISFGYCYTPAGQAARVVFRVHTDAFVGKPGYVRGSSGSWGLLSAVNGVDRFLRSAQEEEANAFCEADGLRFLNSFLQEWGQSWTTTKYGKPFFDYIYEKRRVVIARLREDLLQAMKRVIAIIPRVPQSITKTNISIIVQMIESFPDVSDVADEAIGVLMTICSNTHQSKPTKLVSDYFAPRMTENQKQFTNQAGLDILKNAATKLQNVPAYKESVETAILCLLMTHEISATKTGLLIHWQEWLNFYVENGAWTRQSAEPALPVFLLIQVHAHFFTATSIVEPDVEKCPCGCDGHLVEFSKAFVGVTKMFVRLMLTDVGVTWAQDEMFGPRDCVIFLLWSANPSRWVPTVAGLQKLIVSSLCEFLERLTSSHQYLRMLSELTPPLLDLLRQHDCISLHTGALRVLSLTFRLAVDKKVWSISMETFLESFYQLLESVCDDASCSNMNRYILDVLFNMENHKHSARLSTILSLLHEEHVNFVGGSGQLSPVARSRTKSLLQTLVSLCSLTWNSVLQPVCQIPALISLGWMLTNLEVADDLAQLEVDDVLLSLMENESAVGSILAARAYVVFLFQGLLSRRTIDEYRMKRLCNLLTAVLASGSRIMLSPKRSSNTDNSDVIQFAANQAVVNSILQRYMDFNHERQSHAQQKELDQDDPTVSDPSSVGVIWESNEWNDPSRAMAEKLANHLKLLVVLSSMTRNIVSIGNSDELREIILLLVRFVRERIHSASPQTTLYLLSLRNLIWATRAEILKWGISDLIEPSFLRKLLLLAKDKLYQDLPAGILWGLADAYEKSNMYLLSFEVDDALATGSYFTKKIGFAVMVDNLASKLTANRSIENDCGAMASMIANPASSSFFLTNYGYPFVLKIMESILRLIRAGHTHAEDKSEEISPDTIVGEAFGPMLSYSYAIVSQQERELLQLCRAALRVLEAMQRISPESVLDEAARTKTTILPLLDYPNKLVAQYAVLCCSTHLQTHPTQCGKLVENDVLDKVIAFFFEDEFPPIQVAAFSCIKLVFADHKYLAALQSKLFPLRERIVSCLHSPDFEVKRKAVLFLAEAVFRLDDQTFLDGFAEVFAAVGNNGLIMELFDSVSKEIALNPSADSVLQLLVRLMIKLNLVARTGGDQLVHVICLTLKTHKKDTFLRPVLFNFLHLTVAQGGHVEYLERKSRLDVVTGLLSQQLTLSELRDVANILILVATNHTGIRHYLSGFESGCIPKIAGLLSEFSEYSLNSDNSKSSLPAQDGNLEDHATEILPKELLDEGTAKYLLKVTTAKTVFISHFTEDIYELFLRLLLLLLTGPEFSVEERYGCVCESDGCSNCDPCDIIAKTRCGHYILRLSATHRVLCPTYDLEFLLSAKGDPADKILSLIVKVLEVLAINHQCRVQMLRGSMKADWFWVPVLAKNSMIPGFLESDGEQSEGAKHREESTADTIQLLGHLSAVKEVAQRLMIERPFVSMLFTYLTPTDQLFTSNVAIRRASAFTLARLAEFPLIVRDTFFQENMAMISYASLDNDGLQVSNPERDTVFAYWFLRKVIRKRWEFLLEMCWPVSFIFKGIRAMESAFIQCYGTTLAR